MKAIGVIPARWASTRFEGKVLADINGKPMVQWVWEKAKQCHRLEDVWIACDDAKIVAAVKKFGGKSVLTSADHPSGSDRIAEAVRDVKVDIVVNIQADEPLIDPGVIDHLVDALQKDKQAMMATVIKQITSQEEYENPNVVKVVIDQNQNALYFSRSPIPYSRERKKVNEFICYKHLGLYAYRKNFLLTFTPWPKSILESTEQLEQLRVLEAGHRIKTICTDKDTVGVDTPEDLQRVKNLLGVK
ncbi:MAG: 3-deoxy-manno-octulosonate cytidylyltransferase [Candidatus Omnitrophota bacterium]|nr:3-deoxy-manno-octulosonate cytidylyltransferase [Candidatus Omnitrophota bacterium]